MRRATTLMLFAVLTATSPAHAGPPAGAPAHIAAPPAGATGPDALLVVFPEPGTAFTGVQAAQAADGVRLWVAVAGPGLAPADAAARYVLIRDAVRAAGFHDLTDGDVVVAGDGSSAAGAVQVAAAFPVGAVATVGADPPAARDVAAHTLVLAAELDGRVRVSRLALEASRAPRTRWIVVLSDGDAADLRGGRGGGVLGVLASAVRTRTPELLDPVVSHQPLVETFAEAARLEHGDVCAALQHHTADLDAADAGRIDVVNRADADLVDPLARPEALPGDLGGFLYDKAELRVEDDRTSIVTNSYTAGRTDAPAGPAGASEVMCKTKSRTAMARAVYGDHQRVDDSPPDCAGFTRRQLGWARDRVSEAAWQRFAGLAVEPDDMKRAGPEWVFSPLMLRPADASGAWSVRSPALVTQLDDTQLDPRFAGNHYCKVLSPVRLLELVLTDAVRPGA